MPVPREVSARKVARSVAKPARQVAKSAAGPARFPALLVLGFVAVVACLIALGVLANTFEGSERSVLDTVASPFVHAYASPTLDAIMQGFTFLGSEYTLVPVTIVALAWLIAKHRPREAIFLTTASLGSLAINGTMKVFFQRPRPQLPWSRVLPDYSFPSGHSMNSFVVYVSIGLLIWVIAGQRAGLIATAAAIVLSGFIGLSRIYLGYHYLSDVLGGFIAGALWILIAAGAIRAGPWLVAWRSRGAPKSLSPL